jgi:hypothetical protein
MTDRQKRLIGLIEKATGKSIYQGTDEEEGIAVEEDTDTIEAKMVIH